MFMSADVSRQGRLLTDIPDKYIPTQDIFIIRNDKAREAYINTFSSNEYYSWIKVIDTHHPKLKALVSHMDSTKDRDSSLHPKFHHRGVHDAESLFWVLTWTLLLLDPVAPNTEGRDAERARVIRNLRTHESIPGGRKSGANRDAIINEAKWEVLLGQAFSPLWASLESLQSYFAFPWYRVTEFPVSFTEHHGFEVLRRQLLNAIFSFLPDKAMPLEKTFIMNHTNAMKINKGICCKWKEEIAALEKPSAPRVHLTVLTGNSQSRAKRQKNRANNEYTLTRKAEEDLGVVGSIGFYCKLRSSWF
jgi:hypothetical protein